MVTAWMYDEHVGAGSVQRCQDEDVGSRREVPEAGRGLGMEPDPGIRGTGFFSADQHPLMTFGSTRIRATGESDYALEGELTINDVTRPVTLDVGFHGVQANPADGRARAGFSATTTVNRDDFGVDFNVPLGIDMFALGKKIAVELELQFMAPEA